MMVVTMMVEPIRPSQVWSEGVLMQGRKFVHSKYRKVCNGKGKQS